MENGDERVGGMELRDKKNVENVVLEDKTEGGLEMGSGESVDSEGEVFEEASDSQDQLREKGEKSESGAVDSTIGDCGSMTVAKNSNAETFEEAIGAPVAVGTPDELVAVVSEEKEEDLVGVESSDKIDEGGTSSEVGSDEPSGRKDVFGNRETEVSKAGNGEAHNWETSGGKILPEDGKIEELKDNLDAEYQKNERFADVSNELQQVEDDGPGEISAVLDIEDGDDKGEKLTGGVAVLDSGNGHHIDENLSVDQEGKNLGVQGDSNGDVKDSSVAETWKHSRESYESKTTSAVIHKYVEEPEKFVNGKNEKVRPCAANLGGEDGESSKLLQADERAVEVEKNGGETKHLENKVENSSGDHKIHPAPNSASSSGRSTNTTPSSARPAGLGRAAPLLEPAPRAAQPPRVNGTVSHVQSQQVEDPTNGEADEYDETREKLQMIRVKFLRLAHRLGQTPHNVVVAQVLYRLGLAEQLRGRNGGRVGAFSFDRASAMAEQLEAAGQEPLDFSCTIMVLGKTGVGKSATINSIFDEVKFGTDAFQLGTKKVQDVVGTVQGIKVRVIDTPGLLPSWSDQRQNEKILLSVKHFIKKTPPDIVLYLDRLDMQSRDSGDMPLLRTITEIFGPSIWFNAIVVLTHAASAPPDAPNGAASSYDMFVTQRSHVVQQAIRQAAGDMRLMNPVSLVENHSACRTNRAGQRVLPNGQVWKPHLLLLSFASKILGEANALLKLQDSPPGKPFATRSRAPPLPFLLSSLLQSRPQVKLPEEQFGDEDDIDDDLDEILDGEDESEYDDLPPFKSLTKAQLAKLTKSQKKAYFDELELREKLFMQKQLKEEKRRRKMMKKMAAAAKDLPSDYIENIEEESGGAASVPVPMPDLALPASFDSDYPTHRYRFLDSSNQWVVRPVLETHGWDHDVGYEGINVERLFAVKEKIPLSFSGQVTKDKKDANVQMELASSIKHGEGKATSVGFDMQSVGKDLVYTLRSDTRFSNFRKNKASAGLSITLMGDALSAGMKVEDKVILNKRFQMVISGGAMTGRGDVAYGGSLEAQLRDKDYPLGRSLSTLGLSVMDWHGDLAVGCNIQSQIPVGRTTNLMARANLNNRGSGQISIRVNSSEQLQLALVAFVPLLKKLLSYPQQMQFGQ
uniref:Protein translocase n=1 Tax=Rhizophora mucronata TaxID=61149 RepID=A0A2P2LUC2_RHIMU